MIHLSLLILTMLLLLSVGQALLRALLGELLLLLDTAVDTLAALFFFLVIAPVVWLWEKSKRPLWRTLPRDIN
jgi:hypothetical protein